MNDLFDSPPFDPKVASRRDHQRLSDVVDECKAQAYSSRDAVTFSNDIARLLVDLAERNLPHRPLSNSGKYARDIVILRWRNWRQDQIDKKRLARKTATNRAVEGAMSEIKGLKKVWGAQIVLNETTVKDRVCRKTKEPPRPSFWWEKK
jgi:hypothetical protein